MKKCWMAGLVSMVLMAAGSAIAQPPPDCPMRGGGKGPGDGAGLFRILNDPAAAEKAGISSEDQAKLSTLLYEHRKEMIRLEADADLARLEERRLMDSDTPDDLSSYIMRVTSLLRGANCVSRMDTAALYAGNARFTALMLLVAMAASSRSAVRERDSFDGL